MITLVDGTSLSRRIYHMIKDNFSEDDFVKIFLSKTKEAVHYLKSNHCLVSFGDYVHSERLSINSSYIYSPSDKEILISAENIVMRELSKKGIFSVRASGYESRDIISTIHNKLLSTDKKMCIVSTETTLFSLINENTAMYNPMSRKQSNSFTYNKDFINKYGFSPYLFIDYLMLIGVKKYAISGISGVGEKKGIELIGKFGNIENIITGSQEINGKLGTTLRSEILPLIDDYKEIIKNYDNLNLGFSLSRLKFDPISNFN